MERIFLTAVAVAYVALAAWCVMLPETTSQAVGFSLHPGTGQSEYLTVYGGLQVGLGLLFLAPWRRPEWTEPALAACLVIHACLVVFRSIAFFAFRDFSSTTYGVAVVEWLLLLASVWLYLRLQKRVAASSGTESSDVAKDSRVRVY